MTWVRQLNEVWLKDASLWGALLLSNLLRLIHGSSKQQTAYGAPTLLNANTPRIKWNTLSLTMIKCFTTHLLSMFSFNLTEQSCLKWVNYARSLNFVVYVRHKEQIWRLATKLIGVFVISPLMCDYVLGPTPLRSELIAAFKSISCPSLNKAQFRRAPFRRTAGSYVWP